MSFAAFTKRMAADNGRIYWRPEHYSTLAKHYGISEEQVAKAVPPAPVVSSFPEAVTKAAPDVQRSFRWVMNDGELDRSGDVVVAAGVDTTHFRSNPIALYQHDPNKPIGTWTGVRGDAGKLKGTLNLASTPLAEHVRENIAQGVLKAASIGFVPVEFSPIQGGGFRFDRIELMETSVVSIPASRGSLRERSAEEQKQYRLAALEEIKAQQRVLDAKPIPKAAATGPSATVLAIRAQREERRRVAAMNPDQYREHLDEKAEARARRERDLARIRGRG